LSKDLLEGCDVGEASNDLILHLDEPSDLIRDQSEIVVLNIFEGVSEDRDLRDLLIEVLLIHIGVEKAAGIGPPREFFIEFVEHLIQEYFDVEMPLHSVNYINLIKVSLLIEPTMRYITLENNRKSKCPNLTPIGDKVKHGTQVLLGPELSQLTLSHLRMRGLEKISTRSAFTWRDRIFLLYAK
jgi:hypothetical protein